MSEAATRQSTRLQTNSNGANSEGTSYEVLAEHGENTESEAENAPRRKKRNVSKKDVGGRQTKVKRVRGIRGMLKDVKEMPLDILFEIFSQLDSIDLVNLMRTSKDLRAILRSRSSISVWKAARANVVPTMPDCPDDLSEPQYAELVFGKGCSYCQRKLGTIHIAWLARRRICNKCIDTHCSPHFPSMPFIGYSIGEEILPNIEIVRKSGRNNIPITYYFVEFANLWHEAFDNIADSEEKESWKLAHIEERRAIIYHAMHCEIWLQEFSEYQQLLVQQLRTKRQNEIAERVIHLGWGEEVKKMEMYDKEFQDRDEVIKMCQKELTDRIWLNVDAEINIYMESMKQKRLKRERHRHLENCLPILQKVHNDHLLTLPTTARYWYPMASELFFHEPKIRDIINDASLTMESMKQRLVLTLPEIYPSSINQLIRRIDDQLLELIAASKPEQIIDRETIFGLATTIFECTYCSRFSKRLLRYNEAILHSCTRNLDFPKDLEDCEPVETFLKEQYRSHSNDVLAVSNTALKLVPILIKLCGLDPCTTTAQIMDDINPIFECIPCGRPAEGRATMTWLRAVAHFDQRKHASDIKEDMRLERLNHDDEDAARKRIIEMQERSRASSGYSNPLIQCAHCQKDGAHMSRDLLLKHHMKSEHGIEKPTDKDIILHVDANHIPDIFYMWPPRKPEEVDE